MPDVVTPNIEQIMAACDRMKAERDAAHKALATLDDVVALLGIADAESIRKLAAEMDALADAVATAGVLFTEAGDEKGRSTAAAARRFNQDVAATLRALAAERDALRERCQRAEAERDEWKRKCLAADESVGALADERDAARAVLSEIAELKLTALQAQQRAKGVLKEPQR